MFADDDTTVLTLDEIRWLDASAILGISSPVTELARTEIPRRHRTRTSTKFTPLDRLHEHDPLSPKSVRSVPSPSTTKSPVQPPPPRPSTPPMHPALSPPPHHAEWIYRRPKSPVRSRPRSRSTTPTSPSPSPRPHPRPRTRPQTGYRDHDAPPTHLRSQSHSTPLQSQTSPFWSTILRPRVRSERVIPLLRTHTPMPLPPNSHARTPSIASTISTTSTATTSSSRPPTPTTISSSASPSPIPYHYNKLCSAQPISHSCPPPSKSILTRTSSISTKHSAATTATSKSVKFVEAPTVHYAAWHLDLDTIDQMEMEGDDADMDVDMDMRSHMDTDRQRDMVRKRLTEQDPDDSGIDMGIDLDGMDIEPSFPMGSSRDDLGLLGNAAPIRARDGDQTKSKATGLRRFISLTRKPTLPSTSPTPSSSVPNTRPRPTISGPFALGTLPPPSEPVHFPLASTSPRSGASSPYPSVSASLSSSRTRLPHHSHSHSQSHRQKNTTHAGAASRSSPFIPTTSGGGGVSLRSAPSLESFKSTGGAARSVRSLGSVKSTASTRGFRAWLGRVGAGMGLA